MSPGLVRLVAQTLMYLIFVGAIALILTSLLLLVSDAKN